MRVKNLFTLFNKWEFTAKNSKLKKLRKKMTVKSTIWLKWLILPNKPSLNLIRMTILENFGFLCPNYGFCWLCYLKPLQIQYRDQMQYRKRFIHLLIVFYLNS